MSVVTNIKQRGVYANMRSVATNIYPLSKRIFLNQRRL